jgi:hypothetical protein
VTASVWCRRCRRRVTIAGTPQVSPTGVVRLRGRCACGTSLKAIVGKVHV